MKTEAQRKEEIDALILSISSDSNLAKQEEYAKTLCDLNDHEYYGPDQSIEDLKWFSEAAKEKGVADGVIVDIALAAINQKYGTKLTVIQPKSLSTHLKEKFDKNTFDPILRHSAIVAGLTATMIGFACAGAPIVPLAVGAASVGAVTGAVIASLSVVAITLWGVGSWVKDTYLTFNRLPTEEAEIAARNIGYALPFVIASVCGEDLNHTSRATLINGVANMVDDKLHNNGIDILKNGIEYSLIINTPIIRGTKFKKDINKEIDESVVARANQKNQHKSNTRIGRWFRS